MIISIDAFGGDHAPEAIVQGCAVACADPRLNDVMFRLHGAKETLKECCARYELLVNRYDIVHAPSRITNHEAPVAAIRQKTDSSLVSALLDVKEKRADAFISAGSTGAVLAGATFRIGRLPGVLRPALAPLMPTRKGKPVLLLDIGANVDSKPAYLVQFGMMGSAYMRHVMGVASPRVGLLNNGAEAEKGNELTAAAYPLLQAAPFNFVGNAEGRDALTGDFDVVVSDGFAGNVLLKATEGTAEMIFGMLKDELTASPMSKLAAAFLRKAFRRLRKSLDYTEYGGALLLGVDGIVVKAHGSSNAKAIASAVHQAQKALNAGVLDRMRDAFEAVSSNPSA